MSDRDDLHRPLGFVGALTLLFIALKLTGHIDWSWWWVLSPKIAQFTLESLRLFAEWGEKRTLERMRRVHEVRR